MTEEEPSLSTFPESVKVKDVLGNRSLVSALLEKDKERVQWKQDFADSERAKQGEAEKAKDLSVSGRLEDLFLDTGLPQDYFPYEFNAFLEGYKARGREILGDSK